MCVGVASLDGTHLTCFDVYKSLGHPHFVMELNEAIKRSSKTLFSRRS